jgi:hypothetical protein
MTLIAWVYPLAALHTLRDFMYSQIAEEAGGSSPTAVKHEPKDY